MRLALTNLDTGLFFTKGKWTRDHKLAEVFSDAEAVARVASANNIRNAAAAMLGGEPLQTTGFLWVTSPH